MLFDPLSNTLSKIKNAEKVSKTQVVIKVSSKLIKDVLRVMKDNKYISEFEIVNSNAGEILVITLSGELNNCNCIKPKYSVKCIDLPKFEKRYLPAQGFGILILSTPKGVISNTEAKKIGIGGVLLAYVY